MVNIHTRKITDDLASLVKNLDKMVDSAGKRGRKAKHAFVVYITDDADKAEKELKAFAKKHKIKNIPLTIFDRVTGPKSYKIAKKAEVTVMMWKNLSVAHNHAFEKLNKKSVAAVLKSAKSHLK